MPGFTRENFQPNRWTKVETLNSEQSVFLVILGVRTVDLEKRLHCVKVPQKFSVSTREMRKNNRAYDNGEKVRTKSDYENNKNIR